MKETPECIHCGILKSTYEYTGVPCVFVLGLSRHDFGEKETPVTEKCICACHSAKKGEEMEHERKCCDAMNGYLETPVARDASNWASDESLYGMAGGKLETPVADWEFDLEALLENGVLKTADEIIGAVRSILATNRAR